MEFDVLGLIGRAFRLYFRLFGSLFLVALVVNSLLHFGFGGLIADAETTGDFLRLSLAMAAAALIGASLVTAVSTAAVARLESGEGDVETGSLLSAALAVIWVVIAVSILQGLGVAVGLLLLVIPGILALVWWAAAVPAAVVERTGVAASFARSISLVRGNAGNVFGYGLSMVLIVAVVGWAAGLGLRAVDLDSLVGATVFRILVDSITTPFAAVGYAVLYFELRRLADPQPLRGDTWRADEGLGQ